MTVTDDFSPVAERGELESAPGLLARLRRKHELAPVGAGFVRILLDDGGAPIAAEEQLSAGQKYWSRVRGWVNVDVGDHTLEYEIPFADPTGRAGFVATLTVESSVRDPSDVASRGIASVKDFLEPALREAVVRASSRVKPARGGDPISALSTMRKRADANLQQKVRGNLDGLPSWLSAKIVSVTVGFDAETGRHRSELVKRSRDGELLDADAANEQKETTYAMEVRTIVRENLEPHLSNPATRAFEIVFSDPSAQNIASVVAQVNAAEREQQGAILEVLQTMIGKDFVDKDDRMFSVAAEAIVNALQGKPYDPNSAALPSGPSSGELPAGEVVDEEPAPRADAEWSDDARADRD